MDNNTRKIWQAFLCACTRAPEKVQTYLQEYPDILSWQDGCGETALHFLAVENDGDAVRLLIGHGAEVNVASTGGGTPLMDAALLGHADMCQLLIEHGATLDTHNEIWETPLHLAARKEESDAALRVLLEAGSNSNLPDDFGNTPLHEAASLGNAGGAATLLAYGANVNASNQFGETPLLCVGHEKCLRIVELLVNHGADIHHTDRAGNTLLHHAAYHDLTDVVAFCHEKGLDPEARNKDDFTPADEADRGARRRKTTPNHP